MMGWRPATARSGEGFQRSSEGRGPGCDDLSVAALAA